MLKFNFILLISLLFSCGAEDKQTGLEIVSNENTYSENSVETNNTNHTTKENTREKDVSVENKTTDKTIETINSQQKSDTDAEETPDPEKVAEPQIDLEAMGPISEDEEPEPTEVETETKIELHELFNDVLSTYVSSAGKVNYKGLKSNSAKLNQYLDKLQNNPVQKEWSDNKKLAYWINAYNAFTIKRILDNYPLKSIMNLDGGKTWDVKWIKLGDKTYSLNMIEHEIIRPQFNDARIHFAVNCAAKSCPPLFNKAYTEENVDRYLEQRTTAFINNSNYNTINTHSLKLSRIFDWYGEDFGNLISYLNKFSKTTIAKDAEVEFKEYDWSLNE